MKVFKDGVCAGKEMSEIIAKSGMKSVVMGKLFAARCHCVMARHGNTSNLLAHLRTSHAKIHADICQHEFSPGLSSYEGSNEYQGFFTVNSSYTTIFLFKI